MDKNRVPKPGEIYRHFKDRLYQIITVAEHTQTGELMVVYQALYGDFRTFVRPLDIFLSEVDKEKYPQVKQQYRFELMRRQNGELVISEAPSNENAEIKRNNAVVTGSPEQILQNDNKSKQKEEDKLKFAVQKESDDTSAETVSSVLIQFLDAKSYNKKLEVLTSNMKHLNDRMINDMAVALDCTVDEGPLDQRIQGLIHCLQAMRRFEDRRLR